MEEKRRVWGKEMRERKRNKNVKQRKREELLDEKTCVTGGTGRETKGKEGKLVKNGPTGKILGGECGRWGMER